MGYVVVINQEIVHMTNEYKAALNFEDTNLVSKGAPTFAKAIRTKGKVCDVMQRYMEADARVNKRVSLGRKIIF